MTNSKLAEMLELCRSAKNHADEQIGIWERWATREREAHQELMKGASNGGV